MKEQIKELRVQIDGLAQLTKKLKPIDRAVLLEFPKEQYGTKGFLNSKEIEKAIDSLYLAKAWLGKLLGELGNENPYGSGYKTKEDIVSTQDVAEEIWKGWNVGDNATYLKDKNHIEKVDWLRQEIEILVNRLNDLKPLLVIESNLLSNQLLNVENSYTHLSQARFYLGFEMARIKNEN